MSAFVLVLGGAASPEREVSLRSAQAVAEAARQAGFEVDQLDPIHGLSKLDSLPSSTVVLPILHGVYGEDGTIQRELEKRRLKYLGSDSQVSAICFDKWQTRRQLLKAGVPMPKAALVNYFDYAHHPLIQKPHVLKIRRGGSSIGTIVVHEPGPASTDQLDQVFELGYEAIVEELIKGAETTVPILDGKALPVIEIVPPAGEEFDYEYKYNGLTAELVPPKSISPKVQSEIQALAEKVHQVMGARHLSRVDIMLDARNRPYVLEINTMPGLTDQSLYPKSAAAAGYAMPELVKELVTLASATG